jgi:hypothetical protein
LCSRMEHIRSVIAASVDHMPRHADFIAQNCAATDRTVTGSTREATTP